MPDNSTARSRILASIRMALGASSAPESVAAEYAAISRRYARTSALDKQALQELFLDRLVEYNAGCFQTNRDGIASTVGEVLALRGKRSLATPEGLPASWLPGGFEFAIADSWSNHSLDKIDGALSACAVAIAETGTIVLQNTPGQGPRAISLVPDYFLCVVFVDQIVASVPEAFDQILATSMLPTTFISGPSATADIEMTRIKGVHGPRFLDVILVG